MEKNGGEDEKVEQKRAWMNAKGDEKMEECMWGGVENGVGMGDGERGRDGRDAAWLRLRSALRR